MAREKNALGVEEYHSTLTGWGKVFAHWLMYKKLVGLEDDVTRQAAQKPNATPESVELALAEHRANRPKNIAAFRELMRNG